MGIKIKSLEEWDEKSYGQYQKIINPDGQCFEDKYFSFYRDLILAPCGERGGNVSFSVCRINKRPFVIDTLEYHGKTYEAILPLDGDILMHVIPASASDQPSLEEMEVFHVPKGTMVVLKMGVWHHAAYAYKCDTVNLLVGLPERTYANDCTVVSVEPPVEIITDDK